MLIGYARVSTNEQNLDLQLAKLKQAGCEEIYTDKVSGSKANRPGLEDAFSHLRRGDTFVVWRLDRLGRALHHLIETVKEFETRGIGFKSLTEAIDTTTPGGKLVFHIFAGDVQGALQRANVRYGLQVHAGGWGQQLRQATPLREVSA